MKLKRWLLGVVVLLCCSTSLFAEPVEVRALVMAMFEVDQVQGDFAGEFQHWYEAYLDGAEAYQVKGLPTPLYVNKDGIAGAVLGMGKANAASSLTAILSDQRFDFSHALLLVSGCGGGSPQRVTLGDVVWVTDVVDYELGHGWVESDNEPGMTVEQTFLKDDSYANDGYIKLDRALVDKAYQATCNMTLTDDEKAAMTRKAYGDSKKPSVRIGASVTGDCYWHGRFSSRRADGVVKAYGADTYLVTQMEDNAVASVARRFGLLHRLLICRDIVNYDQPHQGQTVKESLASSSGAFSIGMTNGFEVAKKVLEMELKGQ